MPTAERNYLELLPLELWCMVKACFKPWDLRTHTCFYGALSDPSTTHLGSALYNDDAFWETLCVKNGLGVLPQEDPQEVDWKAVARECAEDAFCDHPGCGDGQLQENGEAWGYPLLYASRLTLPLNYPCSGKCPQIQMVVCDLCRHLKLGRNGRHGGGGGRTLGTRHGVWHSARPHH